MNCAIVQPSYIPWRGFFEIIHKVDVFVFYDCVQYDDRSWRNRNLVKTAAGTKWLTIPVHSRGVQVSATPIYKIKIVWDSAWNEKHLATLKHAYSKAPYFGKYLPVLEEFFSRKDQLLADFTCDFTIALAKLLGIESTTFVRSSTLPAQGTKTDRLLSILRHLGARHYVSGPSAADYIEMNKFAGAGITVEYMSYDYPEYPQLYGSFEPHVTVLDLMFMTGPRAADYIWRSGLQEKADANS